MERDRGRRRRPRGRGSPVLAEWTISFASSDIADAWRCLLRLWRIVLSRRAWRMASSIASPSFVGGSEVRMKRVALLLVAVMTGVVGVGGCGTLSLDDRPCP